MSLLMEAGELMSNVVTISFDNMREVMASSSDRADSGSSDSLAAAFKRNTMESLRQFTIIARNYGIQLVPDLEHIKRMVMEADSTTMGERENHLTKRLPDNLIVKLTTYLEVTDIGRLSGVDTRMNRALSPLNPDNAKQIWGPHYRAWRGYYHDERPSTTPSKETVETVKTGELLTSFIEFLRTYLAYSQNELEHASCLTELNKNLEAARNGVNGMRRDFVGLVGSMGTFRSRRVAEAVTRRRSQALFAMVVRRPITAERFKRYARGSGGGGGSSSFLIHNTESGIHAASVAERPRITSKGFIGYAIDLFEISEMTVPDSEHREMDVRNRRIIERAEIEAFKESVLATYVFRDLTVWETYEDVLRAVASGEYRPSRNLGERPNVAGFENVVMGRDGIPTAAQLSDYFFCTLDGWDDDTNARGVGRRRWGAGHHYHNGRLVGPRAAWGPPRPSRVYDDPNETYFRRNAEYWSKKGRDITIAMTSWSEKMV